MSEEEIVISPLNFPKITTEQLQKYKTDDTFRQTVIRMVNKTMKMYGYKLGLDDVYKTKDRVPDFFYLETNCQQIKRMLNLLNVMEMNRLSALVMLSLCYKTKENNKLRQYLKQSGIWKQWLKTQSYIVSCPLTGLEYTGNSCYQDSTLLALFAIPNAFIDKHILTKDVSTISNNPQRSLICSVDTTKDLQYRSDIQKELVDITNAIRGRKVTTTCSKLRSLIKYCPSSSRQAFHKTGTQDAGEFLQYLFSLFEVEDVYEQKIVNVTNDLSAVPQVETIREDFEKTSPIVLIPALVLKDTPESNINFYLQQTQDSVLDEDNLYTARNGNKYMRRIQISRISFAPYLVFYANRIFSDQYGRKARTFNKIIPLENIEVEQNSLKLFAIVVHRNNHYTCYIRCNDAWFYYNDLKKDITYIGSHSTMLKEKERPNVTTEGVLYFYSV